MAKKAKPKAPPRQAWLPGMKPRSNKKIDDAALIYEEAVKERLPLTKREEEAHAALLAEMLKADTKRYESPEGLIVEVGEGKMKCKVKHKKAEPESNGEAS